MENVIILNIEKKIEIRNRFYFILFSSSTFIVHMVPRQSLFHIETAKKQKSIGNKHAYKGDCGVGGYKQDPFLGKFSKTCQKGVPHGPSTQVIWKNIWKNISYPPTRNFNPCASMNFWKKENQDYENISTETYFLHLCFTEKLFGKMIEKPVINLQNYLR